MEFFFLLLVIIVMILSKLQIVMDLAISEIIGISWAEHNVISSTHFLPRLVWALFHGKCFFRPFSPKIFQ